MKNSGYTTNEILAMQRDAVERVREMQRRANSHVARSENAQTAAAVNPPNGAERRLPDKSKPAQTNRLVQPSHGGAALPNPPAEQPPHKPHSNPSNPGKPSVLLPGGLQNLLNSIGIGEDKAVVLAVIVILLSQNADQSLILALLYLIM